jgi:ABC-type uncharacterized transport system involved in gliding motility auxiliary subunit
MMKRIIDLVSWVAMALVLVAVALRFQTLKPEWVDYGTPVAISALVLLLVWFVSLGFSGKRAARYGTLTAVSVLVVLGILIAINYIGARQNKRWDLTANQQYSLSDQTRNVLRKLDSPLQIMIFDKEDGFQRFKDKLREYEYSSKQVSTEYVDPDKKPTLASQNQVQQYGTILFKYKGRSERITTDTEQDITTGIIKVVQGQQKKVYFTQGHGERDVSSGERDGYKGIADGLTRENYTVDKIVLAQAGSVPDDAAVVVVAGPKTDFLPGEIEALKKYLGKSGKLLLAIDPPDKLDTPPLSNLIALSHDWGIDVGNDIVVDVSGIGQLIGTDQSVPVAAPPYPSHAITQRFNLLTAYPFARSVTPVPGGVNGHTAQGFVQTSPRSWAEADIKGLLTTGKVSFSAAGGDKQGPITVAAATSAAGAATPGAAADAPKPETRVVVYGDSDFAANSGLGIQGNRDLFMNTIGWLSQQENLIAIRPKDADDRRVTMTAAQQTNVTWLSLLFIPAIIFGTGFYSWWRRR